MKMTESQQKLVDFIFATPVESVTPDLFFAKLDELGLSKEEGMEALYQDRARMDTIMDGMRKKAEQMREQSNGLKAMSELMDRMGGIRECGIRECLELIESKMPGLFHAVYPRRFEIPAGFSSPKRLCAAAAWSLCDASEFKDRMPEAGCVIQNAHAAKTISALVEKTVPTYFVSRPIMEALTATDLPKDFSLRDMPWPLDAMLFVIPDGTLPAGNDFITLIAVVKCTARQYQDNWMQWGGSHDLIETVAASHDGPDAACVFGMTSAGIYQWEAEIGTASIFDTSETNVLGADIGKPGTAEVDLTEEQRRFAGQVMPRAAFQIILAMLACPEMIEAGVLVRHESKKKGKIKAALWAPNFFGKAYRRYEAVTGDSCEHGHRRLHWRRGHFRHQRFGPGNKAIRVLWIQPMLIGKDQLAA